MSFKSFLGKYAGEARGVATALSHILSVLPLQAADKVKVTDTIRQLGDAADRIMHGLDKVTEGGIDAATVAKAVEKEVAKRLPAALEKAVADALSDSAIDAAVNRQLDAFTARGAGNTPPNEGGTPPNKGA